MTAILKNIEAPLSSSHRNDMGRQQLRTLFSSDYSKNDDGGDHYPYHRRNSEVSSSPNTTSSRYDNYSYSNPCSTISSPYLMPSPLSQLQSPYYKSPWIYNNEEGEDDDDDEKDLSPNYHLMGSLYREEGHIYSIAACGDLLYTGSDSKNIRVWKNMHEFSGFKSSSGLVKAIVVLQDRIFTGHQDGKIRVWRQQHAGDKQRLRYTRVGTLPTTRDLLMKSMNPKNYVEVRRRKNVPWIKHYDAVSCMCVDEERGLLYSGSWDKTLKVWRVSDFKCLESIRAHDDAVNSVATAYGGLVFTGSADGTVKSWRREVAGKTTSHDLDLTLLSQDHAVTSLAVSRCTGIMYAGSSDGLVNFWTREKHSIMSHGGALRGHKLAVLCLAVGGLLVMSGSADNSVCVWGWDAAAVAHSCVAVLTGHGGPVKCLAVSEDEDEKKWMVYSGSLDNSVKVWRVCEHVPNLELEEL